jgi:peptidoglycan/xylan/chitin deacetylase (PgdA/CDA1 family)
MSGFSICLTHDVDRVRKTFQYVTHDLRRGRFRNLSGLWASRDPYWMIPDLMALEDSYGVRSTFFFLEESLRPHPLEPRSWVLSLGRYRFDEPAIAEMIRKLDAEGWEIGLHGSYRSFQCLELLRREKARLEAVLGKPVIGIRQHYLNLEVPDTWKLQRRAGLLYDASFGYTRSLGWRDGRYQPFIDPDSNMVVIPLVIMECNVLGRGNTPQEEWAICERLLDEAEQQSALLSVLWHQRIFNDREFPGWGGLYEQIIKEGKRRGAQFLTCRQVYEPVAARAESSGAASALPTA